MLTTAQAATRLGITRVAVLKAIARGALHADKIGRDWIITPEALDEYRQRSLGQPGRKEQPR